MLMQQLVLLPALFLVLSRAADDSDSTKTQVHQQAWRESEDETTLVSGRETDSFPSESQDTRSNYKDHPNNGPLVEEERPRPRNRSRSNGKRRRRMRKRPRTTTLEPFFDETWEDQPRPTDYEPPVNRPRFQSERILEEEPNEGSTAVLEETKPLPRRRPGKRRRQHRRPSRVEERFEDNPQEQIRSEPTGERETVTGRKRRKGNGRKRPRVETEPPIIYEESTSQPTLVYSDQETIITKEEPREEQNTKHFTEVKQVQETKTEPTEQTTAYKKHIEQSTSSVNQATKINPDPSTILFENYEVPHQSSLQSTDNHYTEIHYSTTYSTRQESDINSEPVKQTTTTEATIETSTATQQERETTEQTTKMAALRYAAKHKLHSRINKSRNTTRNSQIATEPHNLEYNTENDTKVRTLDEQQNTTINTITQSIRSNKRRLPPTSAVIRRKLKSKGKNNTSYASIDNESITTVSTTHLNTEKKTLQNARDNIINRLSYRNEIEPSTLLPEGFKTNPEILSPMKLLEEVTINEVLKMMTSTTEPSTSEDENYNQHTTSKTLDLRSDRLNLDGIELPNIRDEILDLIKSESGISRVARILELRNMTLKELLDHRERGSSQLHFSENMNKKQDISKISTTLITTTEPTTKLLKSEPTKIIPKTLKPSLPSRKSKPFSTTTSTENTLSTEIKLEEAETTFDIESREKPTLKVKASVMSVPILEPTHTSNIQFPEQGVLGSFPKFLVDTLQHEERTKNPKHQTKSFSTPRPQLFTFKTETIDDTDKREPRLFDSMPEFSSNKTELKFLNKQNKTINWKSQYHVDNVKPFRGEHKELIIAMTTTGRPKRINIDDVTLFNEKDEPPRNNAAGKISAETDTNTTDDEDYYEIHRLPPGVKSAILASGAILGLAILGFLSVLVSCRLRQRSKRLRARRDILCEQLQEDFRSSQCSLSPVLSKSHRAPVFGQGIHSNTSSNRHYYLWRTLRKTFQYE